MSGKYRHLSTTPGGIGDVDGIHLVLFAEMLRLKGGETHGDISLRTSSNLGTLPDTTHETLMQRISLIELMENGFLDAKQ